MNTSQPQRKEIVVPAEGYALRPLLLALGLTYDRVNPLLGEELGAPRDYSMPPGARCVVFNLKGVQRLVRLFALEVDVIEGTAPGVSAEPVSAASAPAAAEVTEDAHGRPQGAWWKKEDLR